MVNAVDSKIRGVGVGLRTPHTKEILESHPSVPWFEVLMDNYLGTGGFLVSQLEKIRNDYPIVSHTVGMNIGSADPLDINYLQELKVAVDRFEPEWVSDHLCWSAVGGKVHHDLLPLPFNEETLCHVVERIIRIQEILNRQILIENVSSYISFSQAEMTEWEFVREVAARADCLILLDINNVYVNGRNQGFEARQYLDAIPKNRVRQMHVAGHETQDGGILVDSHGETVCTEVWDLFKYAKTLFGEVPCCLERDNNIPPLEAILSERKFAESITATEAKVIDAY